MTSVHRKRGKIKDKRMPVGGQDKKSARIFRLVENKKMIFTAVQRV